MRPVSVPVPISAARPLAGAVAGCGLAGAVPGFRFLRHVLGADQAVDDLKRAVVRDGGDAAGDPEILAPVDGAALDPALDLVETFLDRFGFADQLLGPGVVVELGEDALAGLQLLDLGLLFRRALGRLGIDPPIARRRVPVDLDHGRRPLPAGRELVLEDAQLLHGEVVQEHGVVEPDGAVVVLREEIAQHLAAGGLIGLDPRRNARPPMRPGSVPR